MHLKACLTIIYSSLKFLQIMKNLIQFCALFMLLVSISVKSFGQSKSSTSAKNTAVCVLGTALGAGAGLEFGATLGPIGAVGGALAGGVYAYTVNPACHTEGTQSSSGSGSGSGSGSSGGGGATVVRTYATRLHKY